MLDITGDTDVPLGNTLLNQHTERGYKSDYFLGDQSFHINLNSNLKAASDYFFKILKKKYLPCIVYNSRDKFITPCEQNTQSRHGNKNCTSNLGPKYRCQGSHDKYNETPELLLSYLNHRQFYKLRFPTYD